MLTIFFRRISCKRINKKDVLSLIFYWSVRTIREIWVIDLKGEGSSILLRCFKLKKILICWNKGYDGERDWLVPSWEWKVWLIGQFGRWIWLIHVIGNDNCGWLLYFKNWRKFGHIWEKMMNNIDWVLLQNYYSFFFQDIEITKWHFHCFSELLRICIVIPTFQYVMFLIKIIRIYNELVNVFFTTFMKIVVYLR